MAVKGIFTPILAAICFALAAVATLIATLMRLLHGLVTILAGIALVTMIVGVISAYFLHWGWLRIAVGLGSIVVIAFVFTCWQRTIFELGSPQKTKKSYAKPI